MQFFNVYNVYLKRFAMSPRGQDPKARARAVMLATQDARVAVMGRDYCSHFHALTRLLPRVVEDEKRIRELEERIDAHAADAEAEYMATWDDAPLAEDAAIQAAFPTRTGRHDLYVEATRLVGATRSKGKLVALVNWLLAERAAARGQVH
jgi:hypothetical protein